VTPPQIYPTIVALLQKLDDFRTACLTQVQAAQDEFNKIMPNYLGVQKLFGENSPALKQYSSYWMATDYPSFHKYFHAMSKERTIFETDNLANFTPDAIRAVAQQINLPNMEYFATPNN
jgi:hypothetical protein